VQIYLLRHGIAEDAPAGMRDADRALTPEGKQKLRATLRQAAAAGVEPKLILASPYRRARETADLARVTLARNALLVTTDSLVPMADPAEAWEELRVHSDYDQVLCASHEPLCGRLAAYLLRSLELEIDFKKGTLLRIDVERPTPRPRGVLKWMLSPRLAG
jgi:phosphohistidine phosphatase